MTSGALGEIGTILRAIPAQRRRELIQVCLLMPIAAAAEMAMVTAVVPILAIIGGTGADLSTPKFMLGWIERLSPGSPLFAAAVLFIAASLATAVLRLWLYWRTLRFSACFGHDLNLAIQDRLLHQPYLFHVSTNSSRLIASLDKVDYLVMDLAQRGLQGVGATIIGLAVILALLWIDPLSAAATTLVAAILYGLVTLLLKRRLEASSGFIDRAFERRIQLVQESHGGIRDIIIDRAQPAHLSAFASIDEPFMHARAEASFLSGAPRFLVEGIGFCLIALLGLFLVTRPGGLLAALPILGAITLGAQRLLPLSSQIYTAWISVASSAPILRDVASMLRLPIHLPNEALADVPFQKSIRFEQVGFHYPTRAAPALSDLSFSIPRGSRTAIVGKTGAGKSSLADLIMGLIEPTEGQIHVDGTLLAGPALPSWRRSVAHVPQSVFLADTTIARNIALVSPNQQPDMAMVTQAAIAAQLHAFVTSLPNGYETLVGERGANLSGGQRQRLALARAIYRQAPLLVLDEATSALDEETEAAVLASLDDLHSKGCTIVIIAHRLSTVERCDLVLMLDEGKLVEISTVPEMASKLRQLDQQGSL